MKLTKIVTAIVTITSLTACGSPLDWFKIRDHKSGTPPVNAQASKPAANSCDSANDTSIENGVVVSRQTVPIVRIIQRKIKMDCKGNVISDYVSSTVNSQSVVVTLQAQGFGGAITTGKVTNRTTCTSVNGEDAMNAIGSVLGGIFARAVDPNATPTFQFSVDTSPDAGGDLYVSRSQENYLDYTFYLCDGGESKCANTHAIERGTLILTVDYSEKTLPDPDVTTGTCPTADSNSH